MNAMEFLGIFGMAFVIGLSGAMMPGPLLTTMIGKVSREGGRAYAWMIVGHAIAEALVVVLLAAGLAVLIKDNLYFTGIVGVLGGFFLSWMAWGMWHSAKDVKLSEDLQKKEKSGGSSAVQAGAFVSVSSPHWILWWATVGLEQINLSIGKVGFTGPIIFYGGHISSDIAWYGLVAFLLVTGRSFFSDRVFQNLIRLCAGGLVFFSGYFIYDGIRSFLKIWS